MSFGQKIGHLFLATSLALGTGCDSKVDNNNDKESLIVPDTVGEQLDTMILDNNIEEVIKILRDANDDEITDENNLKNGDYVEPEYIPLPEE